MARKPQPGGDRNAWGQVLNEYLDIAHNPDGTIKPSGVQDAASQEVETALGVQLLPAVADVVASDDAVVAAAAAAVDAEPRVSQLIDDTDNLATAMDRVDPGGTGAPGQVLQHGTSGPEWQNKAIYDVRDLVSDTTGATDMRAEFQSAIGAVPAGSTLVIPQGVVLNLSGYISVNKALSIIGPGELRFTANADWQSWLGALYITGNNVTIDGLKMTNPGSNGPLVGIRVRAHNARITNNTLHNWRAGIIQTHNDSEWRGFLCTGNYLTDIYGDGSSSGGDGILAAGMEVIITHNTVRAKIGHDPRIGICIEGLGPATVNPQTSTGVDVSDTSFIVSHNIVTGPFRNAFHAEGIKDAVISENVMFGMRWWGICVWNTYRTTVQDNKIHWTEDGSSFGEPPYSYANYRCGIIGLGNRTESRITGNEITLLSGNWTGGIVTTHYGTSNSSAKYTIDHNIITASAKSAYAIAAFNPNTKHHYIHHNEIRGSIENGIAIHTGGGVAGGVIANNLIEATVRGIRGVDLDAVFIHDNHISTLGSGAGMTGVRVESSQLAVVKHNTITGMNVGINCTGTTNSYAPNNTFISIATSNHIGVGSTTAYGP